MLINIAFTMKKRTYSRNKNLTQRRKEVVLSIVQLIEARLFLQRKQVECHLAVLFLDLARVAERESFGSNRDFI